jgi:heme-degrading monooxygenase HmoA
MSYVVMNVVDVPPERAAEFEHRFATRAGKIKENEGFEAFELLKPEGEAKTKYIAYTRWRSKADFEAWLSSPDFAAGHRQHAQAGPVSTNSETWFFDVLEGEYS